MFSESNLHALPPICALILFIYYLRNLECLTDPIKSILKDFMSVIKRRKNPFFMMFFTQLEVI